MLTEAQSALDRSIKDFVSVAEELESISGMDGNSRTKELQPVVNGTPITKSKPKTHQPSNKVPNDAVTKKEKQIKDPNMPKRPCSAFLMFQNAIRHSVKASMPDETKHPEIQKAIAEKWKDMDASDREKWTEMHRKELQAYDSRIAEYNKEKGIVPKVKPTSRKVELDPLSLISNDTHPRSSDDEAAAASLVQQKAKVSTGTDGIKPSKKRSRKSDGPIAEKGSPHQSPLKGPAEKEKK